MKSKRSNLTEIKKLLVGMAEEAADLKQAIGGSITDAVADWLAPQYLLAARKKLTGTPEVRRWEIFRAIVQDWTLLRRGDHSAARLELDREKLDLERANSQAQKEQEFRKWIKRPEIRKELWPEIRRGLTPEAIKMMEEALNLL